jgi:hypothetical protein
MGCQNLWAECCAVACWVVLCPVVSKVLCAWLPVITKLSLGIAAPEPVELHVHGLECLWEDLLVSSACAVELPVCIGVHVWGWPNSLSVVCMETAVLR